MNASKRTDYTELYIEKTQLRWFIHFRRMPTRMPTGRTPLEGQRQGDAGEKMDILREVECEECV